MYTVLEITKFEAEDIVTTSGSILDEFLNNTNNNQSGWTGEDDLKG